MGPKETPIRRHSFAGERVGYEGSGFLGWQDLGGTSELGTQKCM